MVDPEVMRARSRAGAAAAFPAFLALLATLVAGAAPGCRRSQPDAPSPASSAKAQAARAGARPATAPDKDGAPPNVAAPEAPGAEVPRRPAGVPAAAFWVGGPDGGVFVLLEPTNDRRGTFAARIFHPDGAVWYAGPLVPAARDGAAADIDPGQHDQFAGWDGERLLLVDGRSLESPQAKRAGAPRGR